MKRHPRCEHCGHVLVAPLRSRVLSPREHELLAYLREYIAQHAVAPSHAEIKARMGVGSGATVHELLAKLERKGYVSITPRARRGIAVLPATHEASTP